MQIVPLRSNSQGISGTYANIQHHAKVFQELVPYLEANIKLLPYKLWKQGNNVHLLITEDDRTLVFRPVKNEEGIYCGISVAARFSRSTEMRLFTLLADKNNRNGYSWPLAIEFLYQFAQVSHNLETTADENSAEPTLHS